MVALRKFLVHIIYSHERLTSEISNALMIILTASVRKKLIKWIGHSYLHVLIVFPTIFSPVPFQHFPLLIWREKSHRKSLCEKARERARWPRTVNFCYYVNFVQFSSLFSPEISQEWKENWIYTLDFSSLWCSLISMMAFFSRRRPDTTQKI